MLRKTILAGLIALFSTALAGCDLYFGDSGGGSSDGYTYCDDTGCYWCDDWGCYPDGGGGAQPGWNCNVNSDCAAGCYCASGVCEEAGFCMTSADCADGFECDGRNSCVPEGSGSCTSNDDCWSGSFCDLMTGECVGSWTCTANEDCGVGYVCDDRNTCVPAPCTDDDQCLEGCYCDEESGTCVETGNCGPNGECGLGLTCDSVRNTCVPEEVPVGCSTNADCTADEKCVADTCVPKECPDYNTEATCIAQEATCHPIYTGMNCTNPNNNNAPCQDGDSGCVCETFEFGACVAD